jgi:hypothetical protein
LKLFSLFVFVQPTKPLHSFLKKKNRLPNLSGHHALEAGHVALLGGNLEVAVDDTVTFVSCCENSQIE